MELPDQQLRQRRKRRVEDIVKEFDSFNKVVDTVKEEQTASNGISELDLGSSPFQSPSSAS